MAVVLRGHNPPTGIQVDHKGHYPSSTVPGCGPGASLYTTQKGTRSPLRDGGGGVYQGSAREGMGVLVVSIRGLLSTPHLKAGYYRDSWTPVQGSTTVRWAGVTPTGRRGGTGPVTGAAQVA
jgi:hypothetical protein